MTSKSDADSNKMKIDWFEVDDNDEQSEIQQYKSYLAENEYADEDTAPDTEGEEEEDDDDDWDGEVAADDSFSYVPGDKPVSERSTGISNAVLDATLPGFQPGDVITFGRDELFAWEIPHNSLRSALEVVHQMATSLVPRRSQDEESDRLVYQCMAPCRPRYYKQFLKKWAEGRLRYSYLLGDHICMEGGLDLNPETREWSCGFT